MSSVAAVDPAPFGLVEPERYGRWRLLAGLIGRCWLWFIVGCLLVTFVPMIFGWRPYVIESGSMAPRINVGDVILASPEHDPQKLLGHVTTFNDPDRPGHVKSHRVIKINKDGTLVTKGDANPTPDGDPIKVSDVRGIGRILVRWVGLPLIWLTKGAWLKLLLFLVSVMLAALMVASDHEDEDEPDDDDDDGAVPADLPPTLPTTLPTTWSDQQTPTEVAATRPFKLPGGLQRLRSNPLLTRLAVRAGFVALGSALLLIPTTLAAFGATTTNGSESWSVPNWDYTTQINALGPYLYWKLDETGTATTVAADSSGNGRTGQYNGNLLPNGSAAYFTRGISGAFITDTPNLGVTLTNANSCINTTSTTLINAPAAVTEIIWFKAAPGYNTGGKMAGFEKPRVGVAVPSTGTYDRHLYMDGNGRVWFGVYNTTYITLESTAALNDGNWHMAVGTVGATGTRLYIDGVLQAANTTNTAGEATTGLFRVGCGNLSGWGGSWTGNNNPGTDATVTANRPFQGSLDEYSVFTSELSASTIQFLYWTR